MRQNLNMSYRNWLFKSLTFKQKFNNHFPINTHYNYQNIALDLV